MSNIDYLFCFTNFTWGDYIRIKNAVENDSGNASVDDVIVIAGSFYLGDIEELLISDLPIFVEQFSAQAKIYIERELSSKKQEKSNE